MDLSIAAWGGGLDPHSVRCQAIKKAWVARHSGAENVDAIFESVNERDGVQGRLGEVRGRVVVVHGAEDATWGVEEARRMVEGMVNAQVRLVVLEGVGHFLVCARESEDVGALIGGFLEEGCRSGGVMISFVCFSFRTALVMLCPHSCRCEYCT